MCGVKFLSMIAAVAASVFAVGAVNAVSDTRIPSASPSSSSSSSSSYVAPSAPAVPYVRPNSPASSWEAPSSPAASSVAPSARAVPYVGPAVPYVAPRAPTVPYDPEAAARRAEARADARQRAQAAEIRARLLEDEKRRAARDEERRLEAARRLPEERRTLGKLQSAMNAEVKAARKSNLVDQPNGIADFKQRDNQAVAKAEREQKESSDRWDWGVQLLQNILKPEKPGPEMTAKDASKLINEHTSAGDFERRAKSEAEARELSQIIIKQSKPPPAQKDGIERADDFLKKAYPSSNNN